MKKALTLLLALAMCLSLCACSNSNSATESEKNNAAVENVINMINALDVSLTSGKSIANAEAAYDALSQEQKNAVTNYQNLVNTRKSYDRILNVYTLIDNIGFVDKNSESAIIAAENAYNELSGEERLAITNAATLTTARATFEAIPTEVVLTVDNVKEYFSIKDTSSVTKSDYYGTAHFYYSKINGVLTVEPCVSMEAAENVTMVVRVTCTVAYNKDASLNAEKNYKTFEYDVDIIVSAGTGSGSGSYHTNGNYVSEYGYPKVSVTSIEVIEVTGTVTVD